MIGHSTSRGTSTTPSGTPACARAATSTADPSTSSVTRPCSPSRATSAGASSATGGPAILRMGSERRDSTSLPRVRSMRNSWRPGSRVNDGTMAGGGASAAWSTNAPSSPARTSPNERHAAWLAASASRSALRSCIPGLPEAGSRSESSTSHAIRASLSGGSRR